MKMSVLILSDLHFEFHKDWGDAFVESVDPTGIDVLILAGDVSTPNHGMHKRIGALCEKFPHVVFVPGNHEYYNSSPDRTNLFIEESISRWHQNFHWLRSSSVNIDGVVFAGGTLWFRDLPSTTHKMKMGLNDFHIITDGEPFFYEENQRDEEFLKGLKKGEADIIVTHHSPSEHSVPLRFKGDTINRFFTTDVEEVMMSVRPQLWVHGHTHTSFDYKLHDTRVVCNPFGYLRYEENPGFRIDKVIELNFPHLP